MIIQSLHHILNTRCFVKFGSNYFHQIILKHILHTFKNILRLMVLLVQTIYNTFFKVFFKIKDCSTFVWLLRPVWDRWPALTDSDQSNKLTGCDHHCVLRSQPVTITGSGAVLCRLVHQSNTVLSRDQSRVSHGSEWWWPGSHQVNLCSSQLYVGCITALNNWCWFTFLCNLSPLVLVLVIWYSKTIATSNTILLYHWQHLVSTVSTVSCTEEVWMSCW